MDATQTATPQEREEGQFERLLREAIEEIEGLMLVTVIDGDRNVLFREAPTIFHEPRLEENLMEKCYDAAEDTSKLHIGPSSVMIFIYGAMQVVQFRADSFYGIIICEMYTNLGLVHNLIKRLRTSLHLLSKISNEQLV